MKYPTDAHEERINHQQELINEIMSRYKEAYEMLNGDSKYRKVLETLMRLNDISLNLSEKELTRFKKEYEDDIKGEFK
jgi:hypothetical protein